MKQQNDVCCWGLQNLSVGAKVWGAVLEITSKELIISLPHGLKGHVPAAEVNFPATAASESSPRCRGDLGHQQAPWQLADPGLMVAQASDGMAELIAKADKGGSASKQRPAGVPALSDLFFVNQLVRCTVIELQQVRP